MDMGRERNLSLLSWKGVMLGGMFMPLPQTPVPPGWLDAPSLDDVDRAIQRVNQVVVER